jgi:glucan 1,3-beta-glucosidase
MSSLNSGVQSVGSVTFIDSDMTNTKVGIVMARGPNSTPPSGGSLILENVALKNVPIAVQGPGATTVLKGTTGSTTIAGWGQGHSYTPTGPTTFQGPITPDTRPASLVTGNAYYTRSKPQYQNLLASSFASVRSAGAKGDGSTDDTAALQAVITSAAASGLIVFFDAGTYKVTKTLYIPAGSKIVGESYSVIMSSGTFFSNMGSPQPVVQVGKPAESGTVEWSDMIVSTQGAQAGAILIQWNLVSSSSSPAGMWDVHTRIGGFAGSQLRLSQCPTTSTTVYNAGNIRTNCIAAFMHMHVTTGVTGLYLENNWFWTADHDVEDPSLTQITVYTGRGLYIESTMGAIWLWGTAVEHNSLYQYQLANTRNIFMGQIQTETAYWQPNPNATAVFPPVASFNDPTFSNPSTTAVNADGWGLRILSSSAINVYGAGMYSFFNNYNVHCSDQGNGEACQSRIFSVEKSTGVSVYNLNTVGTTAMITLDGTDVAQYSDNLNGFIDTIALFRV